VSTHYFRFTSRGTIGRQPSHLLERLLARADSSSEVTDWRAEAFRVIAPQVTPMPGVGAAALYAGRGSVEAGSVFVATPLHYVAEMSNVRLPSDGILTLRQSDAEALAVDFNRVWNGAGIRLFAGRRADLFCVVDQPLAAATCDPEVVLDRHIESYLPTGAAAPRLRQLMSEIEMWLFEHAVNRARIADAMLAVNGLWLWGGGPALSALPAVDGWTAGHDVFFSAFAAAPEMPGGDDPGAPLRSGANSGVVVIAAQPGSAEWPDVESRWLNPSLAELRSGRIARLNLSAGNRCFSISARWSRRFWRRHRPWWECFA
jgi:hypothetical protein